MNQKPNDFKLSQKKKNEFSNSKSTLCVTIVYLKDTIRTPSFTDILPYLRMKSITKNGKIFTKNLPSSELW